MLTAKVEKAGILPFVNREPFLFSAGSTGYTMRNRYIGHVRLSYFIVLT